jgi:hypothetical protein
MIACLTCGYEAVDVSRAAQHRHVTLLAAALAGTARLCGFSCPAAAACSPANTIYQSACRKLHAPQQHWLIGSKQPLAARCAQQLRLQLLGLPTLQVGCTAPRGLLAGAAAGAEVCAGCAGSCRFWL